MDALEACRITKKAIKDQRDSAAKQYEDTQAKGKKDAEKYFKEFNFTKLDELISTEAKSGGNYILVEPAFIEYTQAQKGHVNRDNPDAYVSHLTWMILEHYRKLGFFTKIWNWQGGLEIRWENE